MRELHTEAQEASSPGDKLREMHLERRVGWHKLQNGSEQQEQQAEGSSTAAERSFIYSLPTFLPGLATRERIEAPLHLRTSFCHLRIYGRSSSKQFTACGEAS